VAAAEAAADVVRVEAAPFSQEAEEAVLGSVLINPEVFFDIAPFLVAEDFFLHHNRWIWEAYVRLQDQRQPIDILTVSGELERQGKLSEAGGVAYLTGLVARVPTSLHAEAYGYLVEQASTRRRLLAAAGQVARLAHRPELTADEAVEDAEKAIFAVGERRVRHDLQPIKQVLSSYYDRLDHQARHPEESFGVPTGFIDLDRLLGGMQPSDLLIIASRPGQGKSAFCLSVAHNASRIHNKHVAVFSLEMSKEQLAQRLIAQATGIDARRLRLGEIREEEWGALTEALSRLSTNDIYFDDTPALTPQQLRTKCRRLHGEVGIDLVIVDYLQLMTGDERTENRVQEVTSISRSLKALARELGIPVLAAAQLSRAVEQRADRRPVLSDLRESGSLEQDADVVLFIHRPDAGNAESSLQSLAEVIVAKHRNGPVHPGIGLVFRRELATFENGGSECCGGREAETRQHPDT
jgi:replicative DNA helicase